MEKLRINQLIWLSAIRESYFMGILSVCSALWPSDQSDPLDVRRSWVPHPGTALFKRSIHCERSVQNVKQNHLPIVSAFVILASNRPWFNRSIFHNRSTFQCFTQIDIHYFSATLRIGDR